MDFLPNGAIYAILYDGEDADEDYAAYLVSDENALTLFEGGEPIPGVYDPETGVITVTAEAVNGPYITYLQRVTADPLPDVWSMMDGAKEQQVFYGYQMRNESQVMDLVEFLALVDEDPGDYYCLTMQPAGTGHVQFGSEELSGDSHPHGHGRHHHGLCPRRRDRSFDGGQDMGAEEPPRPDPGGHGGHLGAGQMQGLRHRDHP